jgi:pyridine nucleotide-disulfide oxidoreductase family protein
MKRLVLLGGGHAHVHVLRALARAPLPDTQVSLVSPFDHTIYSGMVPGCVAGHYALDACRIPLDALARAAGVGCMQTAATAIDAGARVVTLADAGSAEYDMLSIDTGSTFPRNIIPGARLHALAIRPMETFVSQMEEVIASPDVRDVAVIGGGAGGFELAMALQYRLAARDGRDAHVTLICGAAEPLAGYPAATVRRALRALKTQRITVVPGNCRQILGDHVLLEHGTRVACDVAVLAIGSHAPAWLQGSGLALDDKGYVSTGATLQSLSHPEVFAAGDVASRVDAPHAKSGVHAVRAGPPLVRNLRRLAAGLEPVRYRPPQRTLNLLSCGRKSAIATWGGLSLRGDWLWTWKDHIDRAFVARYRRVAATAA